MKIVKFILTILFITYSTQAFAVQLNKLVVLNSVGQKHEFYVEVANKPQQREVGLMFRRSLPEKQGMLFIFDRSRPINMWMKNTYIPLDVLFIDKNGKITNIARETVPESLDLISSAKPVVAALEINAMLSDKLNIKAGDEILNLADYYKVN